MPKRLYTIISSALVVLVAIASMTNTTAATFGECPPKASCCCSKAEPHGATSMAHDAADSNCQGNAPCCQVQPSIPLPDMALYAIPETPTPETLKWAGLPDLFIRAPQTAALNASVDTLMDFKIPPPRLYLQHQSFLC